MKENSDSESPTEICMCFVVGIAMVVVHFTEKRQLWKPNRYGKLYMLYRKTNWKSVRLSKIENRKKGLNKE